MDILLFQPDVLTGLDRDARETRVQHLCERLEQALTTRRRKPSLVVLPELCTVEYSDQAFENLADVAEGVNESSFRQFSAIAKKYDLAISFSLPIAEKGQTFVSNLVVGADGVLLSRYDKIHLAQLGASHEKRYFSPGNTLSTFTLGGYRFGVLLCYDFRFAEFVRTLCNRGNLDVLLHPVAFTRDETFPSWHHFAITRALENHVYFISVNRAGAAWGNSIACPPWFDQDHEPQRFGDEETLCTVTINGELIADVRKRIPLQTDRLDDYRDLF